MSKILLNLFVMIIIVSHLGLGIIDYTQVVNTLDFIKRENGTQSNPKKLLPLETIFAMVVAIGHFIIGFSFLISYFGYGSFSHSAILSAVFHYLFFFHIYYNWNIWIDFFHPNGSIDIKIFYYIHIFHTSISLLILILEKGNKMSKRE
jgi:hypothetical protein